MPPRFSGVTRRKQRLRTIDTARRGSTLAASHYIELGIGGRWRWSPLGDDQFVNLVSRSIILYWKSRTPWVTLRDV